MDLNIYEFSDKENAVPARSPKLPPRSRPAYSPRGAHISQPPRRSGTLRGLLVESPSRPSYRLQMTKHWTSPTVYRPRSASPRRTPIDDTRANTTEARSHSTRAATPPSSDQSASPMSTGGEGGVPIYTSPARLSFKNTFDSACELISSSSESESTSPQGAPLPSTNDIKPLNDLEAAVARCFDSPSPSREERRKTLHIPSTTPDPRSRKPSTPQSSPTSSEAWTGDEIFLPRAPPFVRREVRVDQPRAHQVAFRHHHGLGYSLRKNCSSSPLRQRVDNMAQETPSRSRFRVIVEEKFPEEVSIDCLPVRTASDADDEDEGSDIEGCRP